MRWKYHLFLIPIYILAVEAVKEENPKHQNSKKKIDGSKKTTDVLRLNVGGEIIMTTRNSLVSVQTSTLGKLFNGRWEEKMSQDLEGNIFLDFNPTLFRYLLEQLRQIKRNPSFQFSPPPSSSASAIRSFNRMLKILGLQKRQSTSNEIVLMNVGGDQIITRSETLNFTQAKILIPKTSHKRNEIFVDIDPWLFRYLLGRLREQKTNKSIYVWLPSSQNMITVNRILTHLQMKRITQLTTTNDTIYSVWNTTAGGDSEAATSGANVGNFPPNEPPVDAFDNILTTKYTHYGSCHRDATESLTCGVNTGLYVTIQRGSSVLVAIQLCTANDHPNRDPLTLTIEGSNQPSSSLTLGSSWSLIYNGSTGLQTIFTRYECGPVLFVSNNASRYSSYRVLVTSIRGADKTTQYSELRLMGYQ